MCKERILCPIARSNVIFALSMGVGGVTPHLTNDCKAHASSWYSLL